MKMPRTANNATSAIGTQRITAASFSTKLPSSMGFINAGSTGSVAARIIMVKMATPNMRQCGRT